MLTFKTRDLNLLNDVNELICQIDTRLTKIAKNKLDSIRYDVKVSCANSSALFFILVKYKKILKDKLDNSSCLISYDIDDIISNIKQYLSLGKLQKITNKIGYKTIKIPTLMEESGIDVNYTYNNYGSGDQNPNSTNNIINTTNVTKEDTWDGVNW